MRTKISRFLGMLAFLMAMFLNSPSEFLGSEGLPVQSEVTRGPYFAGQGFELRIGVIAGGQRPKVDSPRIAGARTWSVGTELRPITTTSIGSVVAHENLFVMRFRIVPYRAGSLEIPAVRVRVNGRAGRSQPKTVSIQPVPLVGRPAEFLGGVGRFELGAAVSPKVVRVGQTLEFRIKVTGPAAWGMTDRPNLERYERIGLDLKIEAKPDETTDEPPARSFVYRLRPTRAGEAVLPPVAIAAFDPSTARYATHVTPGVPIRVVAVPPFDSTTIHHDPPSTTISRPALISVIVLSLAILSLGVYLIFTRLRRRLARSPAFIPEMARRFAGRTARELKTLSVSPEILSVAAQRICKHLNTYVSIGTGQLLGVMTPDEAREGVARLTRSDEFAARAGALAARCDMILYGHLKQDAGTEREELLNDARGLFEALGEVGSVRGAGRAVVSAWPRRESVSPRY